jgi:hypothetical protein
MRWKLSLITCFLAQVSIPAPSGSELLTVLGSLVLIGMTISLYYKIMANRRAVTAPHEPGRRILPDPLSVRRAHEHVLEPDLDRLRREFEQRFDSHDRTTRDSLSRLEKEAADLEAKLERFSTDAHKRINDIVGQLGTLRGAFEQSQRRRHNND